jgi:hypothetical protein
MLRCPLNVSLSQLRTSEHHFIILALLFHRDQELSLQIPEQVLVSLKFSRIAVVYICHINCIPLKFKAKIINIRIKLPMIRSALALA